MEGSPARPSVADAQSTSDAWGAPLATEAWRARPGGLEGGEACLAASRRPPGRLRGVGATAPIRVTDNAKGGSEVIKLCICMLGRACDGGFSITYGVQVHVAQHCLPRNMLF